MAIAFDLAVLALFPEFYEYCTQRPVIWEHGSKSAGGLTSTHARILGVFPGVVAISMTRLGRQPNSGGGAQVNDKDVSLGRSHR